jgi:GNAT superfamily N-acetyltransferase
MPGTVPAMALRRALLRGLERLDATSACLQRARLDAPGEEMWEAADVQWWWRTPRPTDDLALPVWSDDAGPIAAACLTAWRDAWQVDAFAVGSAVDLAEVWAAALEAATGVADGPLQTLVFGEESRAAELAVASGFEATQGREGTAWMEAATHPSVAEVEGFRIVDRTEAGDRPHPMRGRNGEAVAERLRQCSLYDPSLDLAVEDVEGRVAGYALFWFDPRTLVGLVEPMRVEDAYQRRGLGRVLLTGGLDRLARRGAQRLKVGFSSDIARALYLGAGFVQTSVDRTFVRPAPGGTATGPGC